MIGKTQERTGGQTFLWVLDRVVIFVALAGSLIRIGNFMNSEIIGKPTQSNYGVIFTKDVLDSLEPNLNSVAKVTIQKGEKANPPTTYPPVKLSMHFKSNAYQENAIRNYLETHIKSLLAHNSHITEHIFIPEDQPLSYTLTKSKKGGYIANIDALGKPRHPSQLYESFTTFLLFCLLYYRWSRKKQQLKDGELSGIFLMVLFTLRFLQEFLKENQVSFEDKLPLNMGQWLSIPFFLLGLALFLYSRRHKVRDQVSKASEKA